MHEVIAVALAKLAAMGIEEPAGDAPQLAGAPTGDAPQPAGQDPETGPRLRLRRRAA
jgi:hypothetical protein